MPLDSQLCDRLADSWWDDDALLGLLRERHDRSLRCAGYAIRR
jgi:hypothetical protein